MPRREQSFFNIHSDSYLGQAKEKSPEKELLAAILVRAAQDAVSVRGIEPHFRRSARVYFGLNRPYPNLSRSKEMFTFADICDHLSLCPHTIHKALQQELWRGGLTTSIARATNGEFIGKLYD